MPKRVHPERSDPKKDSVGTTPGWCVPPARPLCSEVGGSKRIFQAKSGAAGDLPHHDPPVHQLGFDLGPSVLLVCFDCRNRLVGPVVRFSEGTWRLQQQLSGSTEKWFLGPGQSHPQKETGTFQSHLFNIYVSIDTFLLDCLWDHADHTLCCKSLRPWWVI